jgi:glycosyltransferase involved in cell wall biosynthesis
LLKFATTASKASGAADDDANWLDFSLSTSTIVGQVDIVLFGCGTMVTTRPDVSIVIKALNEERHIVGAIESALAALADIDGEVILADSASTDRTVEIAARYPIKIVRLNDVAERSCGVGVQLGYQYSRGRFICLIDGDMRLHREFLAAAIRFLQDNEGYAGVGGIIVEREEDNLEYVKRASARDLDRLPGPVDHLDCGGVYRREAIVTVGHFGDRNLHSREELELGVRLRALGWKLARIDVPAIDHYGHSGNAYALLRRRWATGIAFGSGEVVRATLGHSGFWLALRKMRRELCLLSAVHVWWLALIAAPFVVGTSAGGAIAAMLLGLLPFAVMSLKCRSVRLGLYSVTAWNVYAAGLWPGLASRRVDPAAWIDSTVIRNPAARDRAAVA